MKAKFVKGYVGYLSGNIQEILSEEENYELFEGSYIRLVKILERNSLRLKHS